MLEGEEEIDNEKDDGNSDNGRRLQTEEHCTEIVEVRRSVLSSAVRCRSMLVSRREREKVCPRSNIKFPIRFVHGLYAIN